MTCMVRSDMFAASYARQLSKPPSPALVYEIVNKVFARELSRNVVLLPTWAAVRVRVAARHAQAEQQGPSGVLLQSGLRLFAHWIHVVVKYLPSTLVSTVGGAEPSTSIPNQLDDFLRFADDIADAAARFNSSRDTSSKCAPTGFFFFPRTYAAPSKVLRSWVPLFQSAGTCL